MRKFNKKSKKLLFVALGFCFIAAYFTNVARASAPETIRVGLMQNGVSGDFTTQGNYLMIDVSTGQSIATVTSGEAWEATAQGGSTIYVQSSGAPVALDNTQGVFAVGADGGLSPVGASLNAMGADVSLQGTSGIQLTCNGEYKGVFQGPILIQEIQHQADDLVAFNGIKYRGNMELRFVNDKLTVINELPLEEYLYGVVPKEMPSSWHPEALKAQAIAARNYALQQMGRFASDGFDVLPTKVSQVYGGYSAEQPSTNAAVDATKGKVMTYNGQLITALYHASSGGFTENSEDVWSGKLDYLRSQPDPADQNDKHYNWQKSFTQTELVSQLASQGYLFSKVSDLVVEKMTTSGARVQILQVIGQDAGGQALTVRLFNADKVRNTFGLKTAPREINKVLDNNQQLTSVTFQGSGWGHGLGMSQYGANGLANQGNTFEQILKHYYSGIQLVDNYNQ